jgi:two-component system response regulator PilR (NtrC family)
VRRNDRQAGPQPGAGVYISGESGTGKELAARLIHDQSARRTRALRAGELRGDSREPDGERVLRLSQGGFTGADSDRGFLPGGQGGTLFLDEVADLPLAMQVKLLRAIQEKKVRKVGSTAEEAVDVRIMSATHHLLKDCVDAGTFRQDLYYRVNVIELKMPPLRERRRGYRAARRGAAAAYLRQPAAPAGDAGDGCLESLQLPRQCARTRKHPRAGDGAV